jgi:hypothetical protein
MFPIFAGSNPSGYNLTRSLRLRSSATAYLSRTPASASNRKTWTWSGWVKRGSLSTSAANTFLSAGYNSAPWFVAQFGTDQKIEISFSAGVSNGTITNAVFRDPSAWYHIVIAVDTTQATASNRLKLYVNNVEQTFSSTNYPSQNYDGQINNTTNHSIGGYSGQYFDGYLTEVNFIDGQALTPSSFGETDTITGVWKPKAYSGTYGTNGFELQFTDNSAATAAAIGKDSSGNGNNWTPNNISVTAGATYDSMTDVPTLTSATAANFAVLNPLDFNSGTVSNGNLQWAATAAVGNGCFSTFAFDIASTANKYYWEFTLSSGDGVFGIVPLTTLPSNTSRTGSYSYYTNGSKYSGTSASAYGATFTAGDIIGVAVGSGTITFYKNGTSQGAAFTSLTGNFKPAIWEVSGTFVANFGQRPFAYTPPTGFVALNTFNLPTSTIVKGNTVMDATLYTGTGASLSVTNAASFKPDLVWVKGRSGATDHAWYDSVRGVQKQLESNTTTAETTETTGLTAFGSAGFTVGALAQMNTNTATYVGWQWQAGQGTNTTNTNGTITSTVSVNASAGFSVVTYTGTGANATVGHGLGVAPSWIVVKNRTTATSTGWIVYHSSLGATKFLVLNSTAAEGTASTTFNNTAPTSTVFSLGSNSDVNQSTNNIVAYCWTPIAGFSAFGSYTGNGNADGPMVYTGFRPKYLLVKSSSLGQNWTIYDTSRNPYNAANLLLYPMYSNAEDVGTGQEIDLLSNGFKIRNSNANENSNGATYIYITFAENPFKNALAR